MALLLQQHSGAGAADQVAGIHQLVSAERDNVLHLAAEQGHHELIQEIYSSFGNKSLLSARNSALDTPLHSAARAGHHRALWVCLVYNQWSPYQKVGWPIRFGHYLDRCQIFGAPSPPRSLPCKSCQIAGASGAQKTLAKKLAALPSHAFHCLP